MVVQVKHEAAIQELLRALVSRNVLVRRFQANDVSLHDIFVALTVPKPEPVQVSEATHGVPALRVVAS
jgi:hypothetical protein